MLVFLFYFKKKQNTLLVRPIIGSLVNPDSYPQSIMKQMAKEFATLGTDKVGSMLGSHRSRCQFTMATLSVLLQRLTNNRGSCALPALSRCALCGVRCARCGVQGAPCAVRCVMRDVQLCQADTAACVVTHLLTVRNHMTHLLTERNHMTHLLTVRNHMTHLFTVRNP